MGRALAMEGTAQPARRKGGDTRPAPNLNQRPPRPGKPAGDGSLRGPLRTASADGGNPERPAPCCVNLAGRIRRGSGQWASRSLSRTARSSRWSRCGRSCTRLPCSTSARSSPSTARSVRRRKRNRGTAGRRRATARTWSIWPGWTNGGAAGPTSTSTPARAGSSSPASAWDRRLNDDALRTGDRLLSAYTTLRGVRLYVITEADRSITTLLRADEY